MIINKIFETERLNENSIENLKSAHVNDLTEIWGKIDKESSDIISKIDLSNLSYFNIFQTQSPAQKSRLP